MKEDKPKNHHLEAHKNRGGEAEEMRGKVLHYLLNPRGEIDGLLLEDGTFVKFPPHLGRELAQVAKPNDEVIAIGSVQGPKLLRGHIIVNPQTDIALREIKPMPPERASFAGLLKPLRAKGKIRHAKRNPHGEIDGAILEDGTMLQFPPQPDVALASYLDSGEPLWAIGFGTANEHGTSIAAAMLGSSQTTLRPIGPAPRKPKKPKPHTRSEDEQEE